MSILIQQDELYGQGQDWPDGIYDGVVIEATTRPGFNDIGTTISLQLGNITTPSGATEIETANGAFNIGARKQFADLVVDHPEEWRVERGRRLALQAMISAGLAPKPANRKSPVEFPYDPQAEPQRLAADIVGQTVRFRLKTRNWKDAETGEDRKRQSIVAFVAR